MKIKRSLKLDEGAYKAIEYMFTKGVDKELIDKAVNDSGLKDYKDMLIAKDFLKKGMLLSICYLED
ncbi:MAG: hypothetical protein D6717_14145 [Gammaproteobacteria bacterium]|nr:MAG: hypothetical protein D6717_14145 [Gammaproteobacteria bacterium]